GPWSLEWLQDHNHGDAGVIFSSSKKARVRDRPGEKHKKISQQDPRRRKAGGELRHPLHSGASSNQSCSVSHQVSSDESSSSGNNDWKNWVAIQGNDQMAVDDVRGIGNAIGVKIKGDNVNMFNVLSRAGKSKKEKGC
ncbi:DUF4283 domain protein, partial [Trifolium medium]|nr:DUF4283 domain protein [Trifolium medium]